LIDPEPDFDSYSLSTLLDAQAHIDRDRYPERAARIDLMVAEKRRMLPPPSPPPPSAFRPQVPPSPLAPRPALVWFILAWQAYCAVGGVSILLFAVTGGYAKWVATLPPEMRRLTPAPSTPVLLLALGQQMTALVAALKLFFQSRIAPLLFTLALALEVVRSIAGVISNGHSGFIGAVVILAGLFGGTLATLQLIYSARLRRAGWLCNGAA
jgi:hypothetical protein